MNQNSREIDDAPRSEALLAEDRARSPRSSSEVDDVPSGSRVVQQPPSSGIGAPTARVLPVGDFVVIAAFVVAGMAEHRTASRFLDIARNLLIFLGAWALLSWITRLYGSKARSRVISTSLATTWFASITLGVLVRAAILGRPLGRSQLVFWAVALVLTGAGLAAWRVGYFSLRRFFGETKQQA